MAAAGLPQPDWRLFVEVESVDVADELLTRILDCPQCVVPDEVVEAVADLMTKHSTHEGLLVLVQQETTQEPEGEPFVPPVTLLDPIVRQMQVYIRVEVAPHLCEMLEAYLVEHAQEVEAWISSLPPTTKPEPGVSEGSDVIVWSWPVSISFPLKKAWNRRWRWIAGPRGVR
jgi:hypothetical protein